ncbi:hypothetical protein H6G76_16170 [Nostoc sp. FACHB-152]|uniref:DUF6006 family protein n=1 Tax=unclassified Nostoc TaxID=2593658 RepID=UPI001683719A|nr:MULTISPECIES: DUF6006 family protein [unclassified Nostoc]MBD2448659.1 hypothetical protein [Nostoc sp. FACHB-152]MBD2468356.1 hypothetical protein [Nostoc sp. FACHB-145]
MKNITKWFLGWAIVPASLVLVSSHAKASQIASEWFFGLWDCNIDGRPAQMQWKVVNDPQTSCNGDICSTTSGVRLVGRFSDHGSAWVPLAKSFSNSRRQDLGIRYLGAEQDNWYLRYNSRTKIANGWTTWRGNRYPLQCRNRR